jgi:hypothetical protein
MRTAVTARICQENGGSIMRSQNGKTPNAFKHGVFAGPGILDGESREAFGELQSKLVEEWKPNGPTEEETVLSIAKAIWRKRRAENFLDLQLLKRSSDPSHPGYDEATNLRFLAVVMRDKPETAFEEWAARCLRADKVKHLRQKVPRSNFESNSEWAQAVINEINSVLLPEIELQDPTAKGIDAFMRSARALSDDLFDRELALDERLDAMIDRAVKRLIQTKAMKQMLGQTGAMQAGAQQTKMITRKTAN